MRHIRLAEILTTPAYESQRTQIRSATMQIKELRRIHVGQHLTFLFENPDTVRYQVQEMLRIEGHETPEAIEHEVRTYNELLGDEGGLGCTLMIEIDDPAERDVLLRQWLALPRHLRLEFADGSSASAGFDERQVGDDRLSSVQYLKFDCAGRTPVAITCDLPGLELRQPLTDAQRAALEADLAC